MKALLKNYRQSPRKVRLVADVLRGKSVAQAKRELMYLSKKSSPALEKLLDSAVANARSMGVPTDNLFVKKITVDKGTVMRRARPFARGRSGTIQKVMSIVALELGTAAAPAKKAKKEKAAAK
jgi:large subunit ribosomal protein L22